MFSLLSGVPGFDEVRQFARKVDTARHQGVPDGCILELDLQNAAIALPSDLWDKPAGESATASLAASVSGEGAIRLDALELDWNSQIEQFEQLVFNQSARTEYHAINKQSVSLL